MAPHAYYRYLLEFTRSGSGWIVDSIVNAGSANGLAESNGPTPLAKARVVLTELARSKGQLQKMSGTP
jgi:hypothetical protein